MPTNVDTAYVAVPYVDGTYVGKSYVGEPYVGRAYVVVIDWMEQRFFVPDQGGPSR